MTKAELRKIYLEKRAALSPDEAALAGREIAHTFFSQIDLSGVAILHTFIPIDRFNEIDTLRIFRAIWRDHPAITTLAPRIDRESGAMLHVPFDGETELVQNPWGISEPVRGETVAADRIDLVLVPALCFDREMHRVGFGKGFYDRFLQQTRPDCIKIGLDYFDPVPVISDTDGNDQRVDLCITPRGSFVARAW